MTTSPLTSLASNMIMASPESVAVWESKIETDIPVYFLNKSHQYLHSYVIHDVMITCSQHLFPCLLIQNYLIKDCLYFKI